MEVLRDLEQCRRPAEGSVVSIGAYDGVHLGHVALLARVRAMAADLRRVSAVVTFDRHPATVVRPESAPRLLCDLDQKLELLAATGVDRAVVLRFDAARATESAEEFVTDVLVGCLGAQAVVVGHDFHFGHRRRGDVAMLQALGADLGFDVLGVTLTGDEAQHRPVSSTRIRGLLAGGDVAAAAALLGRRHEVRGVVEQGDRRGRQLGFATANVAVPAEIQLPADGIYAGWYRRPDGVVHPAAISLGRRPTFHPGAEASVLEAHLLDFDATLYGETAAVAFAARLRDEVRFDSADALIAQMAADVDAARVALAAHPIFGHQGAPGAPW
ncbi:MAG: bifunctional riboflavin kinase/FAD synthetase [Acidimicrobiales bacterium]